MFDTDQLIADCQQAVHETEPRIAVKEVLTRAMARPEDVVAALPATDGGLFPLYTSDELSVVNVVWAPGMRFRPHNHLMWAAIGLYGGREDNTFYRRSGRELTVSGGRDLHGGDVVLLGDDTIHSVENPSRSFTGAIHVYGGDIINRPGRSEWDETTGEEIDYDFGRLRNYFDEFVPVLD